MDGDGAPRRATLDLEELGSLLGRVVEKDDRAADGRRDRCTVFGEGEEALEERRAVSVRLVARLLGDAFPFVTSAALDDSIVVAVLAVRPVFDLDDADAVQVVNCNEVGDVDPQSGLNVDRPVGTEAVQVGGNAQLTVVEWVEKSIEFVDRRDERRHTVSCLPGCPHIGRRRAQLE